MFERPILLWLLLATPLVLRAAERWGWARVLAASGAIWLLAQLHLRDGVYVAAAHFRFSIPLREMGTFDLFAWQLLWAIGLCLGSARAASLFSKTRIPHWLIVLSATVAVVLFLCRHTNLEVLTGPALFDVLVNKWRLGILRQIDAAAIGVLLVRFGAPLAETRPGSQLAVLGRAPLEVFSAHIVFCLLFLGLAAGPHGQFTAWQDGVVLAVTLSGLFLVAHYVRQRHFGAGENNHS